MECPTCGAEASGNFCSSCGGALKSGRCPSCQSTVPSGSRFCTSCGKPIPGARKKPAVTRVGARAARTQAEAPAGAGQASKLAWWVAGVLLVVVLVALGYPILKRGSEAATPGAGENQPTGVGGAGSGLVDLTTMPLEEQATLLFNRVMTSNSTGDTADVAFFLPKALVIHEQVNPTDPDGIYHYALLHMVGQDYQAALAKADEGLAQVPDYLLLLAVSAEARLALGDSAQARELYARLVGVYDTEMAMMRPGYDHHSRILPAYREEAQAFLRGK